MTDAIIMFSGGLDSTLAARMMKDQGIGLTALHLTSPFCTCDRGKSGCNAASIVMAEKLGIEMITVNKGKDYFRIVKNPRFGYGRGMNPCIDCRIFGLEIAREFMREKGAKFIVTGEVLGQRPMSQRRDTINLIERESGLKGLILRPLSARFFPSTLAENEGWVDRNLLMDISGRSRKKQMELAGEYEINDYPCPAGGCLLTDRGYSSRVRDLFDHVDDPDTRDFNLLKLGRHMRLPSGEKLIIPRNEGENRRIEALGQGRVVLIFPTDFPGPVISVAQVNSRLPEEEIALAFRRYSKNKDGPITVKARYEDGEETVIQLDTGPGANPETLEKFLVK